MPVGLSRFFLWILLFIAHYPFMAILSKQASLAPTISTVAIHFHNAHYTYCIAIFEANDTSPSHFNCDFLYCYQATSSVVPFQQRLRSLATHTHSKPQVQFDISGCDNE